MKDRAIGKRMLVNGCTELALGADGALPTEFVIFTRGDNPSTKGPAIWDGDAAASVMRFVAERGKVDYMIDLEHRSLDGAAVALSNDAADAMGWFNLELRGGDLWAVNVRWTPEGTRRLQMKTQRYTSPAFYWLGDEENGRVGEVINVALVSMPATNNQAALVAASRAAMPADAGVQESHDPAKAVAVIQTGLRMLSGHDVTVDLHTPTAPAKAGLRNVSAVTRALALWISKGKT